MTQPATETHQTITGFKSKLKPERRGHQLTAKRLQKDCKKINDSNFDDSIHERKGEDKWTRKTATATTTLPIQPGWRVTSLISPKEEKDQTHWPFSTIFCLTKSLYATEESSIKKRLNEDSIRTKGKRYNQRIHCGKDCVTFILRGAELSDV